MRDICTTDTLYGIVIVSTVADIHHVDIIIYTTYEPLTILRIRESISTAVRTNCRFLGRWSVTRCCANFMITITFLPTDTLLSLSVKIITFAAMEGNGNWGNTDNIFTAILGICNHLSIFLATTNSCRFLRFRTCGCGHNLCCGWSSCCCCGCGCSCCVFFPASRW